jgi:hypothetical protein
MRKNDDYQTFNDEVEEDLEHNIGEQQRAMRELEEQQILVQARNIIAGQIRQDRMTPDNFHRLSRSNSRQS